MNKLILEKALKYIAERKSPFSGYLHLCYETLSPNDPLPIPVKENLYAVLALLESKSGDNMALAKETLQKLLHFQCPEGDSAGNFPIYLHQYPACLNRYLGSDLLCPLLRMLGDFGPVLGSTLREKVKTAIALLLTYCFQEDAANPARISVRFTIAAAAIAFGALADVEWSRKGEALLAQLPAYDTQHAFWWEPESLASLLIADTLVQDYCPDKSWKNLWTHAATYWHPSLMTLTGVPLAEQQFALEPVPTLLDLIMSSRYGTFSKRIDQHPYLFLQGILIRPSIATEQQEFLYSISNGTCREQNWMIKNGPHESWAVLDKPHPLPSAWEHKNAFLRLLWGSSDRLHSFVCQGGNIEKAEYGDNGMTLTFELTDPPESDEKGKNRDISFYLDRQEELSITVNGTRATTFHPGDRVEIQTKDKTIQLLFQPVSEGAQFMGHIMPANRPSQIDPLAKSAYQVYDWHIFLRTVSRTSKEIVKVFLQN